ncbi:MAG: plasmid pRiA4b ORF-3 family protein [Planctomycetes bacterium]|jgi:hypothetical protein|nr:plasmid pRiA4b ORF-3 family protein [Planctomycetota bacterium]
MAAHVESVLLTHFIDADETSSAYVRRLAAHYGDLVRYASQVEPGRALTTPVPCRRRPGRKACRGLLVAGWERSTRRVEWQCPHCGACGAISEWMATPADLRAMRRSAREDLREVAVAVEALAVLRDVARADPELGRLAFSATVGADGSPVLSVGDDERERYRSRLATAALTAGGKRAIDLLMTIVDALTGSQEQRARGGDLVELDFANLPDLLQQLLSLPNSQPPEFRFTNARGRPARMRKRSRAPASTFQIKVSLRNVRPPIWRRLQVPADILLPKLHAILQAAMGWHDCHLHLFRVGEECYAPPGDWEPVGEDSREVALADLAAGEGARLVYEYDFGDGWTHDLVVEAVLPQPCTVPRCVAGRRRCPPEDSGGPFGYGEFVVAIGDRAHERHAELSEWLGEGFDPAEFDVVAADAAVRRAAKGW